jgi:translocation and assembly module TamB
VILSGGLTRYLIPGLGIVDVTSELKVVPGPNGHGTLVTGKGRAWVRRFDNKFLAGLAGGLPQIETDLVRGTDLVLHFRNLRLTAPKIRIAGNGYRRRDGTFFFEGTGVQGQYGQFAMTLDGRIERPKLAIRLARPNEALGLADVLLNLDPTRPASPIAPRADRRSGTVHLARRDPAARQPAGGHPGRGAQRLGTPATGSLRSDPGGFTGRLDVPAAASTGGCCSARSEPSSGSRSSDRQQCALRRAAADLRSEAARSKGDPARSGRHSSRHAAARGVSRGPLSIASLDASGEMRGGTGRSRARIAGTRGRDFASTRRRRRAGPGPAVTGQRHVDRAPIELTEPALADPRERDGWRLAPTALTFAGGNASLSGLFGGSTTESTPG